MWEAGTGEGWERKMKLSLGQAGDLGWGGPRESMRVTLAIYDFLQ